MEKPSTGLIPVIFGEVLFDVFPDGTEILGGAPFNVAWHLKGLGHSPLMISAVGRDNRGDKIFGRMENWGMDISGIQVHEKCQTGEVKVTMKEGEPTFDVMRDRAYDYIDADNAISAITEKPLGILYHGTLAARNHVSEKAMLTLRKTPDLPVFIDINLRSPYWGHERVESYLKGGTWIKLNESELLLLGTCSDSINYGAGMLRQRIGADWLIVTQGEKGAFIIAETFGRMETRSPPVNELKDSVGAGDAFSAVMISGLLRNWPVPLILERAAEFAAEVCKIQGATTDDKQLYESVLDKWKSEGV